MILVIALSIIVLLSSHYVAYMNGQIKVINEWIEYEEDIIKEWNDKIEQHND